MGIRNVGVLVTLLMAFALSACGGGGGGDTAPISPGASSYTIGGTVSGLASGESVVLQNNGGDDLTVSADGVFTFATSIVDGGGYTVTVKTQPQGQICKESSNFGNVAGVSVTQVSIACSGITYSIGGAVSGLASGKSVVLQNNGGDDLTVSANGVFTFATTIVDGGGYEVTVKSQPQGQICKESSNFGNVTGADVDTVIVTCEQQSGSLDSSFGIGGKVLIDIRIGGTDHANALALQPDGKMVVAGDSSNGADLDFALARYNTNGSSDNWFGTLGKVTTAIGSGNDVANALALQPDGKILVAGYSSNGADSDFVLVRYNTDGSLDTNFGTLGKVTTAIGGGNDAAYALALQSDGKIVVAGYTFNGADTDFALVRYNGVDGSLDTNFGTLGKVTTAIGTGDDYANAIALQPDGKIVVAGKSINGGSDDFALARYNGVDGSLDTNFGTLGKVTTAIGGGNDAAYALALQSDGKIVVAGKSINGGNDDFALARYNGVDGSLDTNFGALGKITTAIGSSADYAKAIAVQPDGKIVVAGGAFNAYDDDFSLVRYNDADGSLDTTFGTGGKVTTNIASGFYDSANAIALQSDGKIVVAGTMGGTQFVLARYWP